MLGTDESATNSYASTDPPVDLAANAESYGVRGEVVESVGDLEPTLSGAFSRSGTDVLDVLLDDADSELR